MSATYGDLGLGAGPWPPSSGGFQRPHVRIPLPDGLELIGDLYRPAGEGPWPVIVERTPYGAAALRPLGECYAAHGYLFLAVDVRGRFRSAGEWDPLTHEKSDGAAVIRWAAALPECNGRVGTRGHSYAGVNQLLAAPHSGPSLRAMVVGVAPADAFDNVPFQGGAYHLDDFLWAWLQAGPTGQLLEERGAERDEEDEEEDEPSGARRDERGDLLLEALHQRPFVDADVRLGLRVPYFREWVRHWRRDAYWRARSWLPDLRGARIPALHISGWWDSNGRGAALAFEAMGGASGGQRLLLGPWGHDLEPPALTDLPEHERALIRRAARRDAFTDELAWFEQHLNGYGRKLPAAEVFVTGAWQWIEAADWPPPGVAVRSWFLRPEGGLDVLPSPRGRRSYRFDPAEPNPVNSWGVPVELAPYDTTPDVREDVLVYRSEPLTQGVLALGDVRLLLRAITTARDIDWVARLVDEYPDGRTICVRDGVLRARFRAGYERPRPVTPDRPAIYAIDLWHVGHLFRIGHRLRVEIASSALGRWDVNPGDGGDLATSAGATSSAQTILHGGRHGSRLLLPVAAPAIAPELLWPS